MPNINGDNLVSVIAAGDTSAITNIDYMPLVTAAAVALMAMAALAVYAAVCNTLKQINKGELPYALQQTNS